LSAKESTLLSPAPAPLETMGKEQARRDVLRANALAQRRGIALTARQAAQILARGMKLWERRGVAKSSLVRETISWRFCRDDWHSFRWVTAVEYGFGVIQLRNNLIPSIPKAVWPFKIQFPPPHVFRLMLHWSEVNEQAGANLFDFCCGLGGSHPIVWPLFNGDQGYPECAWTVKAQISYEERNKRF